MDPLTCDRCDSPRGVDELQECQACLLIICHDCPCLCDDPDDDEQETPADGA